jgi:hypothetical protein
LTYVPPEKKTKGGTSGFGDIVYVILFFLVEGAFVFIGVPILVIAVGFLPVAMYLIITQGAHVQWFFYTFVVLIVFIQILALQYFVKRFILEPHKMNFREWVRYRLSPSEIRKRRDEKRARHKKMEQWYAGMDRVHARNEQYKEEQQTNLRNEWFGEGKDPEDLIAQKKEDGIVIIGFESEGGSEFEPGSDDPIILGSESVVDENIEDEPVILDSEFDNDDSPIILGTGSETEESSEFEFVELGSDEEDKEEEEY